jgi:urease accessory protein
MDFSPQLYRHQREGRFDVVFERHGSRTYIERQYVSYPYHLTRPFELDPSIPSLVTLYQQSSSGGLYRGDRLISRLTARNGAAAHITTQAATIVHDCHGSPARQEMQVDVGEGCFLAYTPEPLILFPGAYAIAKTTVKLRDHAVVVLQDAFTWFDFKRRGEIFDQVESDVSVYDSNDTLVLRDRFCLSGRDLSGPASPVGRWRVVVNVFILADNDKLPSREELETTAAGLRSILGVTELPNNAGVGIRMLADDAGAAQRSAANIFCAAVAAMFGETPAPRRK